MIECCSRSLAGQTTRTCPVCEGRTVPVGVATIKALLTPEALARIETVEFRFCPEPSCEVVYASDAGQVFRVNDVRVPVWQKRPPGDRTLCYCFGENERDMQWEMDTYGSVSALARVRGRMAEQRCDCDCRNPRGTCCLGDLTAAVARIQAIQGMKS